MSSKHWTFNLFPLFLIESSTLEMFSLNSMHDPARQGSEDADLRGKLGDRIANADYLVSTMFAVYSNWQTVETILRHSNQHL